MKASFNNRRRRLQTEHKNLQKRDTRIGKRTFKKPKSTSRKFIHVRHSISNEAAHFVKCDYQIKWKFEDTQLHEIDALTLNKSEKAFIDYLRGVAKAVEVKIEIRNVARIQGSFLSDIAVFIGENKEVISPLASVILTAATAKFFSPNPKPKSSKLEEVQTLIDIQEKYNNGTLTLQQTEIYIEALPVSKKQKNAFFKANKSDKTIKEIVIAGNGKEIATISSASFDDYIFSCENENDEIPNAKIYIISPVIVAGSNEMWSGEYEDERIRFYVKDREFLWAAQSNQIQFNTGFYIDCTLRRKVREGEEKTNFDVLFVNKYASDKNHVFSFNHKPEMTELRANKLEVDLGQTTLFDANEFEDRTKREHQTK
ncbi:hypothetical protein OfM1_20660 [Lactovum odontotermitis]